MNRKIARSVAFPALTLVVGMGAGAAWNHPVEAIIELPKTERLLPFTTQIASSDLLKDMCFRSAAYAGLIKDDRNTRRDLWVSQFTAMPYSDRGVICRVVGKLRIMTHEPGSQSRTERSESVQVNILASVTGESEIVSDAFVKALTSSTTMKAMSSNVGNEGTVQLKPRF